MTPAAGQVWEWSADYGPLVLIHRTQDWTGEGAWTAYSLRLKAFETLWVYDRIYPAHYIREATEAELVECGLTESKGPSDGGAAARGRKSK